MDRFEFTYWYWCCFFEILFMFEYRNAKLASIGSTFRKKAGKYQSYDFLAHCW